ncbi:GntR family transcriptional regulator [Sporichthya sp.]|uniref:GntR family transcriptional regulator n=1 Tax=Sporichthya sp. TaxID=65475 RepID=UPI0017B7D7E5|nr:GntR family transcriptional regulator [Sporichthya sp.]MBA3741372.1 GntR family transcriptional regulator [Sporichthya sp.]
MAAAMEDATSPRARTKAKAKANRTDGPASERLKLPAPKRGRTVDTVAAVADELRHAILRGHLVPGEKIRQDALAEQLGVSRIPVREALKTLAANGLLEYTMNLGFSVARLNESDFRQLYRLRRLIEEEMTTPLPDLDKAAAARLASLSRQMVRAAEDMQIVDMVRLNREFHFEIFQMSGLSLMVEVVGRMWDLAAPYHSTYLFDPTNRQRVIREHKIIRAALAGGDQDAYHEAMAEHRAAIEAHLSQVLRQPLPFGRIER